ILVQYPNYLGCLEDLARARGVADPAGALLLVAFDPGASGLVRSPGEHGADVVVGEVQPLGTPLSLGAPALGLAPCPPERRRRPTRPCCASSGCARPWPATSWWNGWPRRASSPVCPSATSTAGVCWWRSPRSAPAPRSTPTPPPSRRWFGEHSRGRPCLERAD